MRAILVLVFVVAVLALIGWITFSNDGDRTSINLETQEIKEDSEKVLQSGKALLEKAESQVEGSRDPNSGKDSPSA